MSFAIYGESDAYVHLVGGETEDEALELFFADIWSVGVKLKDVFNIYAAQGNQEATNLENRINQMIETAKNDVQ